MNIEELADRATKKIYEAEPSLLIRFGERGKEKCLEDNHHHLKQLQTAYELNESSFFIEYALWLNGILTRHGMKTKHLIDNFEIIRELLATGRETEQTSRMDHYLTRAITVLKGESAKGEV